MAYSSRRFHQSPPRRYKNTKKTLVVVGIVVLLSMLILLFLALFTDAFAPQPRFSPLPVTPGTEIAGAGDNIFYLKGSTLYCTDFRGEVRWTAKFSAGQQKLAASESIVCLYSETSATLLDGEKNPLFTVPPSDFIIRDVVCGKASVAMLCELPGETPTQYIRIFSAEGTEYNRVDLQGGEALDFEFSGPNDSLWYMTLDSTGVYPISQITTLYPSENKLTGMYQIYNQLVSEVLFFDTDMYVSGTTYLSSYDTFGNKIRDTLIYGTKCVASYESAGDLVLAYAPAADTDGTHYTVRLLSRSGIDTLIQLPSGIRYFALSRQHVYCFTRDAAYLYKYSGEFVKTIPIEFALHGVRPLTASTVLLEGTSAVYIMNLE